MGMSLYVDSKILSKEEYNKLINGEYYLSNYEGLNFIDKQEIDAEINKLLHYYKENGLINNYDYSDEEFKNIIRLRQWTMNDYMPKEYLMKEDLYQFFQDNYKYFRDDGEKYFTINEWLNYEDDCEGFIERTIDSANINGQDIYCLIESKFW